MRAAAGKAVMSQAARDVQFLLGKPQRLVEVIKTFLRESNQFVRSYTKA